MLEKSHCRLEKTGVEDGCRGLVTKQLLPVPRHARMLVAGRLAKPVNTASLLTYGPPDASGFNSEPLVQ